MKTQAWGWLAAAVMAAGLNASYHDGGLRWAHQIVDHVGHNMGAVMALATGRTDQFLTEARYVATPSDNTPCSFAVAMVHPQEQVARVNAEFDRFQAMSDRQVARLARLEANRARIESRLAAVRIPTISVAPVVVNTPKIVCPRVRMKLSDRSL
jgi:hypothetical protein